MGDAGSLRPPVRGVRLLLLNGPVERGKVCQSGGNCLAGASVGRGRVLRCGGRRLKSALGAAATKSASADWAYTDIARRCT